MLYDGKKGGQQSTDEATGSKGLAESFDASVRPVITVDIQKYQSLLDESGMSDAQKEEFLQALWSIVVTFVELGFGVHPLQEVCGKDSGESSARPKEDFDKVRSKDFDETKKQKDSSPKGGLEVQ